MKRSSLVGCLAVVGVLMLPTAVRAQTPTEGFGSLALGRSLDWHLRTIRVRAHELASAAAEVPAATTRAAATIVAGEQTTLVGLGARLILMWLCGWLAERLFRGWSAVWTRRIVESPLDTTWHRAVAQMRRLLFAQGLVLSSSAGVCLAYLIVAPQAVAGVMALDVLLAVVAVRTIRVMGRFLFAPGGARLRLVALSTDAAWRAQHGITALAIITSTGLLWSAWLRLGGADLATAESLTSLFLLLAALLVPFVVGAVLVAEHGPDRRAPAPAAVALGLVPATSWLLAQAGLPGASWAALVLGLAPVASRALSDMARTVAFGPNHSGALTREERIVARATRNTAAIAALLLLAKGLPESEGGFALPITADIISSLLILLGADLSWQIVRGLIDRGLARSGGDMRADRLATVLPAVRTIVLVAISVSAALSIASAFGLQIGPLLAGAGVVGLTIGFGAQALVRDVIAGFFLLLDDAFRVGETIESGNLQGQVEAFSLRSVRLRDDNGRMHTVAFGELKAVTNFSRDWAGLEIPIYVPHGVSYEVAAGVMEAAIADTTADETLIPLITSAPKFLGPTALSETSVRLAVSIRTIPGSQARIRSELLRHVLRNATTARLPLSTNPLMP